MSIRETLAAWSAAVCAKPFPAEPVKKGAKAREIGPEDRAYRVCAGIITDAKYDMAGRLAYSWGVTNTESEIIGRMAKLAEKEDGSVLRRWVVIVPFAEKDPFAEAAAEIERLEAEVTELRAARQTKKGARTPILNRTGEAK